MAGSGTTLAVARALGHRAFGFDTDPLAVLISRAWCQDIDAKRLRRAAKRVLRRAQLIATTLRIRDAYPAGADEETRSFVRYWFGPRNRRELASLAQAISRVRDPGLYSLLFCAFSRLIIAKQAGASLALDLAHSRPHKARRKPKVVRPLTAFLDQIGRICAVSPFSTRGALPRARVSEGDARDLPLKDGSVDVVITSPPYVNAIDYQRMTKFSLVWFRVGVKQLRRVRAENVGTEAAGHSTEMTAAHRLALRAMGANSSLPPRTASILAKYVRDMDRVLSEVSRVLTRGGRAVVVIGDSTLGKAEIRNSRALLVLARTNGLHTVKVRRRKLPPNRRYLPPPRRNTEQLDARLRTEVVLHLRKSRERIAV
ncbi:MAG TPA: hypothetical protein VHO06_15660 [Polyangia bacterium]|nr:hypothetical protein [Polyangia bacterium]